MSNINCIKKVKYLTFILFFIILITDKKHIKRSQLFNSHGDGATRAVVAASRPTKRGPRCCRTRTRSYYNDNYDPVTISGQLHSCFEMNGFISIYTIFTVYRVILSSPLQMTAQF